MEYIRYLSNYNEPIDIKIGSYHFDIIFVNKDYEELGKDNDGVCLYNDRVILVRNDLPLITTKNIIIHELVHAFLMTQGRWCQKKFTDEELCEFIAFTHYDLHKIMEKIDKIFNGHLVGML